jgi:Protein of unknown function (DUF2009)
MNPEKMRSEFGKLIYMLMDSGEPNVQVCAVRTRVYGRGVVYMCAHVPMCACHPLPHACLHCNNTHAQELLGFRCVRPLRTVALLLEERGGSALLDDPLLEVSD